MYTSPLFSLLLLRSHVIQSFNSLFMVTIYIQRLLQYFLSSCIVFFTLFLHIKGHNFMYVYVRMINACIWS